MQKNLSKEQIFEHFEGKSSLLLKRQIEAWLQNPEHQELYYVWLEEWERKHIHWQTDVTQEFTQLQERIDSWNQEENNEITSLHKRQLWQRPWFITLSVAASMLLILSFVFQDKIRYHQYSTAYGALQNLKLEDGTNVTLNANSTLQVPRFGFGTDTREVILEGEAYFSVKHTPTHQKFVVKSSNDFSIEVLGTEFSVRKRNQAMQVVLDKGKVTVHYGHNDRPITMTPGDLVTLGQDGKAKITRTNDPQKYSAWRSHRFVFDKTPLLEIAELLEDNFGLKVEIQSTEIAQRTISGEIEAKTADELTEAIAEILNLKIIRNNQQIKFQENN